MASNIWKRNTVNIANKERAHAPTIVSSLPLVTPMICILRDPGADSGGERKSKWAGKYGTKKSRERREEPLGTMSYQTSSKLSSSFWLLIGARKLLCFSALSEGRTAATVWNWSGKTWPRGSSRRSFLFFVPYFPACLDFLSPPLSAPGSPRMFRRLLHEKT